MTTLRRKPSVLAGFGAACLATAGCTGVEPAVLGLGWQAAESGYAFFDGVDIYAFELARYDDVILAVDRAARVLSLEEYSRRTVRDQHTVTRFRLKARGRVIVEVRAETDTITRVRCEVGGNLRRGISAIFFRQLIHELESAGAYIETWAGTPAEGTRGLE